MECVKGRLLSAKPASKSFTPSSIVITWPEACSGTSMRGDLAPPGRTIQA